MSRLSVDIKKRLGDFQLDVQFETEGEVMALLGASGCGKSMTLNCIAGLLRPDSGRIALGERVLFDSARRINLSPQQRRVGYLFQHYALFPNLTARQNIAAGCRLKDRDAKVGAVDAIMARMQIAELASHRPHQLSGGQQQRVALARIIINEPELLLLDEPLSALDSYLRWQMESSLHDSIRGYPAGTLYVSHSREEVYRLCDSVCVLSGGKSEAKQGVKALFAQPRTLSACLLSGCKNFSRARPDGEGHIFAIDWGTRLRLPPGKDNLKPLIGLRAHYVQLHAQAPEDQPSFPCRVQRVTEDVFSTVISLATPGGHEGWAQLRSDLPKAQWTQLSGAQRLYVTVDPKDIMLLDP